MRAPLVIRNIVFDVGWVLVRLNYRPLLDFLAVGAPRGRPWYVAALCILGAVYFVFRSPGST
jgi:hypothetical protein